EPSLTKCDRFPAWSLRGIPFLYRKKATHHWRQLRQCSARRNQSSPATTGFGDVESAFIRLERAFEQRVWLGQLKVAPVWDPLRKDPRSYKILQRMGLMEENVACTAPPVTSIRPWRRARLLHPGPRL